MGRSLTLAAFGDGRLLELLWGPGGGGGLGGVPVPRVSHLPVPIVVPAVAVSGVATVPVALPLVDLHGVRVPASLWGSRGRIVLSVPVGASIAWVELRGFGGLWGVVRVLRWVVRVGETQSCGGRRRLLMLGSHGMLLLLVQSGEFCT